MSQRRRVRGSGASRPGTFIRRGIVRRGLGLRDRSRGEGVRTT